MKALREMLKTALMHPLTRQSGAMLMLRVASFGIAFVYGVLLARILGAEGMGVLTLARTVAAMAGTLGLMGFHSLLLRQTAVYQTRNEPGAHLGLIRRADQITLIVSILAGGATFGVAWVIARDQRHLFLAVLAIFLAGCPIWTIATLRQAVVRGGMRVVAGYLPELITQPALACIGLLAWLLFFPQHHTPVTAAVIIVATQTVGLLHAWWICRPSIPREVTPIYETREWIWASFPMMSLGGLTLVNQLVDQTLIAGWCSHADIGRYSVASRIAGLVTFFSMAAGAALTPRFAAMYASGQHSKLQRLLALSTRAVFNASLLLALLIIVARHPILMIFGADFVTGDRALTLLCTGYLVNAALGPADVLLVMAGQERIAVACMIIATLTNATLDLILIPAHGIEGAALATVVTIVIWKITLNIIAHRRLRLAAHIFARRT